MQNERFEYKVKLLIIIYSIRLSLIILPLLLLYSTGFFDAFSIREHITVFILLLSIPFLYIYYHLKQIKKLSWIKRYYTDRNNQNDIVEFLKRKAKSYQNVRPVNNTYHITSPSILLTKKLYDDACYTLSKDKQFRQYFKNK